MDADGGNEVNITEGPDGHGFPAWGPGRVN